MELWALLDSGTPTTEGILGDAVDVFLGEAEARSALAGVLGDMPEWVEILTVERVATVDVSLN
jgi:hypothetical protein